MVELCPIVDRRRRPVDVADVALDRLVMLVFVLDGRKAERVASRVLVIVSWVSCKVSRRAWLERSR